MKLDMDRLKFLLEKKNVVGFSRELLPKIVKGVETKVKAIRVYVEKKVPEAMLVTEDIIPKEIDGIPTDVVEVGRIVALSPPFDPTARVRPLTAGVSIGNIKITAGTLGWYYLDKDGNRYLGSNAHIFCDEPFADQPSATEIVQPGPYDGGNLPYDLVGHYVFHKKIMSPPEYNKLDFAVSTVEVDCDWKIWQEYTPTDLVGHLFAGSQTVTIVFKGKYIQELGYSPLNARIVDVQVGDHVEKWGRTSGHNSGTVIDTSAVVRVYYDGSRYALFDDQIITEAIASPGDSVAGDTRLFYRENGVIKYGTVAEAYESYKNGNRIDVLSLRRRKELSDTVYPSAYNSVITFEKAEVLYHGMKPVWKVTFHNGKTIEITKDHSLFSFCGYDSTFIPTTLDKLDNVVSIDDYVFEGNDCGFEKDLLNFAGLWIADGSWIKKEDSKIEGVCISTGNEKGIVEFLKEFCDKRNINLRYKSKGDYRIYSTELVRSLLRLGLEGDWDCYTKRVPRCLFTAKKEQVASFLKGYFSGDGSIHLHDGKVAISCASVNRELLVDIKELLSRLGIRSIIDSGYIPLRLSKRKQYKLKIEGKFEVKKFLHTVGLLKEYPSKYDEMLEEQPSRRKRDLPLSKVGIRTIEFIGLKPVYDFKVNPTESFIANGVLCHNSGSAVWKAAAPSPPYPIRRPKKVIKGRIWIFPVELEVEEVEAE